MSRPAPTKAEADRITRMVRLGCVITRLKFGSHSEPEVHHIVDGYRLGHWWTLPLNPWYHRKVFDSRTITESDMVRIYGYSIEHGKPLFEKSHGHTELELWQMIQRQLGLNDDLPVSKIVPRREVA